MYSDSTSWTGSCSRRPYSVCMHARERVLRRIARLPPASFSMVMATGIVAVAARQQGFAGASLLLFTIGAVALVVLWVLLALRLIVFGHRVLADLEDHARAPGFFTTVAATAVTGSGCATLLHEQALGLVLLAMAVVAWVVLTYAVFTGLTIATAKPPLPRGIDGSWLLAVVATQSLAVLAAVLTPELKRTTGWSLAFPALCAWLLGGVLYTWLMTLVLYRTLFFRFEPDDLTPPWWINMGAMAISTLAGAELALASPLVPILQSMLPFVRATTVLYWATASWWLPLLLVLNVWRVFVRRDPLRGGWAEWSAVFPLGMYSVASGKMAGVFGVQGLLPLSAAFFWIAAAAWLATAVSTIHRLRHAFPGSSRLRS